MTNVLIMGVCPECQSECPVSDNRKFCLPHDVCGNPGFGPCKGSFNTGPEATWEYGLLPTPKELCREDFLDDNEDANNNLWDTFES